MQQQQEWLPTTGLAVTGQQRCGKRHGVVQKCETYLRHILLESLEVPRGKLGVRMFRIGDSFKDLSFGRGSSEA